MSSKRSRLPPGQDLPREMVAFFEQLDKRVAAQTDLEDASTTTELITAFNTLLAGLRTAGKMEKS